MSHHEVQSNPLDWIDQKLNQIDEQHLRRHLRDRSTQQAAEIELDGKRLINFSSNDYLGIARDRRLIDAVSGAVQTYGWGAGASPLITGHSVLHRELEHTLAELEQAESALLFPTGYAANVGTITALADQDTILFSDSKNHASIIDGCRLAAATTEVYRHNDIDHLRSLLESNATAKRKLIVTDGLFSMDGDLARLDELAPLAESHGAMLMVDEAHATGVLGKNGRGTCEHFGVESDSIIRVGTLSKALGSLGGFVVGSKSLIDWLTNRSRTLIFSTAAPPAICAAGLAALEIVKSEPQRRVRLAQLASDLRKRLTDAGHNIGSSRSQIIPVVIGNPKKVMATSQSLLDAGILVPGIRPPSVPAGESLLRISLSYDHTEEMIDQLLDALAKSQN